jgi:dTDP-4-dehydrorhamnose reductase|tara:strand:- start:341 stop:1177 length:837 start_codon:yes stop_codon:yes gene_type:complete
LLSENISVIGTASRPNVDGMAHYNINQHRIKDCIPSSFLQDIKKTYAVICIKYGVMDNYVDSCNKSEDTEFNKMTILINDLCSLGIKPVYFSTSYVFDGNSGNYKEDSPQNPISEYGRLKARMEKYIYDNRLNLLTLRLDKIVGDDPSENHLFSEWYKLCIQGKEIDCIKGQILSPTFVKDVVNGVVLGCKNNLQGLYNFANQEFISRIDLAKLFVKILNFNVEINSKTETEIGLKEKRPLKSYLDSSAFIELTGIKFSTMQNLIENFSYTINTFQSE